MKFDFSKYKGKYAMHCKTEEEAKDFCRVMHEDGRKWDFTGDSFLDHSNWSNCGTATCYNFNKGTYYNLDWYKKEDFTILEWEDFMEKQFTKADLKDGMVGITRRGDKYLFLSDSFMNRNGTTRLCNPYSLNNDLTVVFDSNCDIVRICKSKGETLEEYFSDENLETIWTRPEEVTEMTVSEIKEALGISGALKIKEG